MLHAYRDGGGPPRDVRLAASVGGGELHVTISDDGTGPDPPRPDSPGLGLGLPLIATLADHLEVASGPEGGTSVAMDFALTAAAAR